MLLRDTHNKSTFVHLKSSQARQTFSARIRNFAVAERVEIFKRDYLPTGFGLFTVNLK